MKKPKGMDRARKMERLTWEEMSRSLFLESAKEGQPSAPPRAFPLGLLAPRFHCPPLLLATLGRRSCLGEGSYPSPSFSLILVPSDSGFAQPPSTFAYVCSWCRFRFLITQLRFTTALILWHGRPSRKCPKTAKANIASHVLAPPTVRALPPAKVKRIRGRTP